MPPAPIFTYAEVIRVTANLIRSRRVASRKTSLLLFLATTRTKEGRVQLLNNIVTLQLPIPRCIRSKVDIRLVLNQGVIPPTRDLL